MWQNQNLFYLGPAKSRVGLVNNISIRFSLSPHTKTEYSNRVQGILCFRYIGCKFLNKFHAKPFRLDVNPFSIRRFIYVHRTNGFISGYYRKYIFSKHRVNKYVSMVTYGITRTFNGNFLFDSVCIILSNEVSVLKVVRLS